MKRLNPARFDEQVSRSALALRRIFRHARWVLTSGLNPLIEEDRLNLFERGRLKRARQTWQAAHPEASGLHTVVFLLGVQRSGTNMLARTIEEMPYFDVYHENDGRVFDRFLLRDLPVVDDALDRCRSPYALVKALSDSHRAVELLLHEDARQRQAKILWLYRDFEARARSAVAKFGDVNQRVLTAIAEGVAGDIWQSKGLSESSLEMVNKSVRDGIDAHSGAVLFWLVRNEIYFESGLDERDDALLVHYERLVSTPVPEVERICSFLGVPYEPRLTEKIAVRSFERKPLDLPPGLREACEKLSQRFDALASLQPGNLVMPVPASGSLTAYPTLATEVQSLISDE
jgi:hypothetical protein